MISTLFEYNGIRSEDMGISIVRKDSGLFPVVYVSPKEILDEYPSRAESPYFYRTKMQQLTFTLTFAPLEDAFDKDKLYQIGNWLFQNTYKPFISDDNTDKILYCMATSKVDFITNGLNEGYIDVEFKCKYPYAFLPTSIQAFNLSTNTTTTNIQLGNFSNVNDYYYPEIEITLVDTATSVSLMNLSDGGRITALTGLSTGETIYINNSKKQLISSTGLYKFDSFNLNWLRLVTGQNTIQVTGKCIINVRCNFPVFM
jgi:phage-related protein